MAEEKRYINVEPHPDFSLAYWIYEGVKEAGYDFLQHDPMGDPADEANMVEIIKPVMMVLRMHGANYCNKLYDTYRPEVDYEAVADQIVQKDVDQADLIAFIVDAVTQYANDHEDTSIFEDAIESLMSAQEATL